MYESTFNIVGPPLPPALLIEGEDLPKIESLGGGVRKFLLKRGDKPEKKGLIRNRGGGGCHFFINLKLNRI